MTKKTTKAKKTTGRTQLAIEMDNLRKRARRAVGALEREYKALTPQEQKTWRGKTLKEQQARLNQAIEQTKLGRQSGGQFKRDKVLAAQQAKNKINSMIGGPQTGGKQEELRQERRNRMYRSAIRAEESGGISSQFSGQAGQYHFERIFYMSTQSVWAGLPNEDRDQAIMKALGVKSLEEAYQIILQGNADAIMAIHDQNLTGTGWEIGYLEISGYITDIEEIIEKRQEAMADYR